MRPPSDLAAIETLKAGPMSAACLAVELRIDLKTARGLLDRLNADKRVHILVWAHGKRGPYYPIYVLGPGEDAPSINILRRQLRQEVARRRAEDIKAWYDTRSHRKAPGSTNTSTERRRRNRKGTVTPGALP